MRSPFAPIPLLIFFALILLLLSIVQVGAITIAFDKLGLSASSAGVLLLASLIGSGINLPLFSLRCEVPPRDIFPLLSRGLLRVPQLPFTGTTLITLNVGGGLIPGAFALYLVARTPITAMEALLASVLLAGISYAASRPIANIGIGMPVLIAPLCAALIALLINPEHSAPLAYVCGTWGVLIGADMFRLNDIRMMGVPTASIGGAGTFDGIFITGVIAVLLA